MMLIIRLSATRFSSVFESCRRVVRNHTDYIINTFYDFVSFSASMGFLGQVRYSVGSRVKTRNICSVGNRLQSNCCLSMCSRTSAKAVVLLRRYSCAFLNESFLSWFT